MTDERSAALADEFAATNEAVIAFAQSCDAAQWATEVPGEDWPVGVVVHHIAEGHGGVLGWLETMARGEPVTDSGGDIDQRNAAHAGRAGGFGVDETVALLRDNGARLEAALRGLTGEELARTAPFGPADGATLPVEALAAVTSRHAREHLAHAQSALGVT